MGNSYTHHTERFSASKDITVLFDCQLNHGESVGTIVSILGSFWIDSADQEKLKKELISLVKKYERVSYLRREV